MLSIADNENEQMNNQIVDFVKKCGEITMKMMISDPPLLFDCNSIGQKIMFNQHKQDSMDGFIKVNEECFAILPPVYKLIASSQPLQESKTHKAQQNGAMKQQLL